MLDLDHFKAINDTHGHAAGDSVIRALANLLRQRLRRIDSLGRYGGEEFVVVLPECPAAEAARIFDEIRERFAELTFNGSGDRPFRVTFSAGICETEGDAAASAYSSVRTRRCTGPSTTAAIGCASPPHRPRPAAEANVPAPPGL